MNINTAETSTQIKTKDNTDKKSVGGLVPTELYWQFTTTRGERHESAAEALEHALRLYVDISKTN